MFADVVSEIFDRAHDEIEEICELYDSDVDTSFCESVHAEVMVVSSLDDRVPVRGRIVNDNDEGKLSELFKERRIWLLSRHSFAKVTAVGTDETQDCDVVVRSDGNEFVGKFDDAVDRSDVKDFICNMECLVFSLSFR
jgi:hypothetical protein